jgi:hypothetical protein
MPRKPIELPPEVAKAFVRDMRAFKSLNLPVDSGYSVRTYQAQL